MFLGQFFVKDAKKDPRTLCKRLKSDKFWISRKCRNGRNSVKMSFFGLQNTKTRSFFKICTWNIVHIYTWQGSHTCNPFFLKIKKNHLFENIFFVDYFLNFPKFPKFRKSEIHFDRNVHCQSSVGNQSLLSFKLLSWQPFPQTLVSA